MVDDALDDARVVAQVDEGQVLAVLAPAGHPAAEPYLGADVVGPEHAAEVAAHGGGLVLLGCGGVRQSWCGRILHELLHLGHHGVAGDGPLFLVAAQRAEADGARFELLGPEDQGDRARRSGRPT